jgi:hypothetical protein
MFTTIYRMLQFTLLALTAGTTARAYAVNSYSRHDTSEFCSANQLFQGSWTYGKHTDTSEQFPAANTVHDMVAASYQHCPRTRNRIKSSTWMALENQVEDYSCDPGLLIPAQFEPSHCRIMHEHQAISHIRQSLGLINSTKNSHRPITVLFLGDSIGGQLLVALDCVLHEKNLAQYVNLLYAPEYLFRRDIPCEHNCTLPGEEGEKYRQQQKG